MSAIEGDGDDDPLIGRVFASRYKIEERLGSGAMGTVYKARHVKVGRAFAVKMLHERLLLDDKLRKRFDREAELAGKLHHINVVGVVDVGETEDGIHFMVMEFADGAPLGSLMDAPMSARRVIDLVKQLCDGLQHAHEHGLIHRDFKPDNVIVERDKLGAERPRIVDFGIAILRDDARVPDRADRLTTAGLVLGTPHYMAPEQAMGGGLDPRIDLFALGVICYEMLTGKLPYDGDGVDVARANLLIATPPMGIRVPHILVDPLLEAFTRLLMQKDPARRPQTAKEARRLLDLIATDRVAAAAELEVELPDGPGGPTAVSALAPPTDGSRPVFAPPIGRAPVAAPSSTPSRRAVTMPERGTDASVVTAGSRRAATHPDGAPRATNESRAAARLPVVDERRATDAVLASERNASAGAISGPGLRAATDPGRDGRALTEPGRARRAATVLPHPRRLLGIGIGVGLVVTVVMVVVIATRGGGSSDGSAPGDATPAIAIAPADVATAVAIDAGVAAVVSDAALAAGEPATDAAPSPATDATVIRPVATPKPRQPKPPKVPKQPQQPVAPAVLDTSASVVAQLYGAVGRELKALDGRRGSGATSPLWPRYLRIRINDALTTPDKRLEAHRALSALRREIAAQR